MNTKSICEVMAMVLLCSACAAGMDVQWVNSLLPKNGEKQSVALSQSGEPNYVILLSSQPTTIEQKASDDLSRWLGVLSGADFKIVCESSKNSAGGKYISIGNTQKLDESGLKAEYQVPGDDGYVIAVKDGNLFLWGPRLRGVINAVYAMLEEDIGCRWYTRNVTKIPHRETLTIDVASRSYTPVLKQRFPCYREAFDRDWALRNRTIYTAMPVEWGGSYNHPHSVHTLSSLLPAGKYFKEHPEYYSEKEGIRSPTQPCLGNPDAVKIVAENIKKVIKANPNKNVFSVSLNDGKGYCCCEKCLEIDKQNGWTPEHPDSNRAGSLIHFVNGVAEIVERDYPDVLISTLAYLGTADAPTNVKPRKNVVVRICDDMHSWSLPLIDFVSSDQPESVRFRTLVEDWSKICDNILIWEYTTTYSHYLSPLGNMNRIEPMVDFYIKHGIKGIMFQGNYSSFGGTRSPLRSWVLAKHLWDPDRKVADLMQDFATGMYGSSAGEILEYYKMLDQIGLDYQSGKKPLSEMKKIPCTDPSAYDKEFILKAFEIFQRAQQKADNPAILQRVELEKLPLLYLIASNQYDCWPKEQILEFIDELELLCRRYNVIAFREGLNEIDSKIAYFRAKANFDSEGLKWVKLEENYRFKAVVQSAALSPDEYAGCDVDDSGWETISGWKEWDYQGYPGFSGTGWYRQKFSIPSDWPRQNGVYLLVGGIDEQGIVYVNGKKIHEHTIKAKGISAMGLYQMKLMIPLDGYVDREGENQLTIEVMNNVGAGGLYKPVYIISSRKHMEPQSTWEYINSIQGE